MRQRTTAAPTLFAESSQPIIEAHRPQPLIEWTPRMYGLAAYGFLIFGALIAFAITPTLVCGIIGLIIGIIGMGIGLSDCKCENEQPSTIAPGR